MYEHLIEKSEKRREAGKLILLTCVEPNVDCWASGLFTRMDTETIMKFNELEGSKI